MTRRTPDARISPSDFLGALGHFVIMRGYVFDLMQPVRAGRNLGSRDAGLER